MSNPNLSNSFEQLRNILTTSNDTIGQFRNTNKAFHASLIEKIKAILVAIQNIASNPNIQKITIQLDQSQSELSSMQQQLQDSNAQLVALQQQMTQLQQQKTELENQVRSSGDTNGQAQQKIQQLEQQVNDCLADQSKNIDNISQVNELLARQVENINGMLQESNTYNSEYDQEIVSIASNLQIVVDMLNGTNKPPGGKPSRGKPPANSGTGSNVADLIKQYEGMAGTSGGKKRRTRKRNAKKYTMKRGGYNWSNIVSNDSQSVKSSSSSPKSRSNLKNYRMYSRKKK